jgi:hypothetical protein
MDWAKADQLVDDIAWLERHGALAGVTAVIAERRRQIQELGYTIWHDRDEHADGSLGRRAADKAGGARTCDRPPARSLAQAGALAAAEIDRLGSGPEA